MFIESVSLPNIKIKQLYIKWNEKLNISVKESNIHLNNNNSSKKLSKKQLYKIINKLPYVYDIFESIYIEKATINDITLSYKYVQDENGFLIASSPTFLFDSKIFFDSKLLNMKINKLYDIKRDIKINGNIILDPSTHDLSISADVNIHNEAYLKLFAYLDENTLLYKIKSPKDIKSLSCIMDLINLNKGIKYWAYEAIGLSSLSINNAYGWIDFNDLDNAYKNIYASVIGHNLTYRYNKKLDVIHSKETRLEFKEGVLYIRPQQHYTYKSKLGKSWLKIDFTKKEELLTLHLLFDAKLDKDTLGVLKAYKIDVPFLQNSGITKTDLTIKVYLRTINIDAKGDFLTKKANFRYQGFDIDIFDAHIKLDNYDVQINNMLAKYKNMITTDIDANYNAKDGTGLIDFDIKKIDFKKAKTSLSINDTPLKLKYIISKKQDKIFINNSLWKINNDYAKIDKITLPFNLKTGKLKIPNTNVSFGGFLKASISGSTDLKKVKLDLDVKLQKLAVGDIKLVKNSLLKLKYDKNLSLKSNKRIDFYLDTKKIFLDNPNIEVNNSILTIKDSKINFADIIKTTLSLNYSLDNNSGYIETKDMLIEDEKFGLMYSKKATNIFNIYDNSGEISINSKELSLSAHINKKRWSLDFDSLSSIAKNSKLLQKYFVKDGNISFNKLNNEKQINLTANIKYPHKILVIDNKEVENYSIDGKFYSQDNSAYLNINNIVNIKINKDSKIDISTQKIGVNTNAIFNIVNDIDNDSNTSSNLNVSIIAKDSYLYISKKRHIISQYLDLQYNNNILNAKLNYYDGIAKLKFEKGKFYVHGDNFNDRFMEELFSLSDFKGGKFEFNIGGNTNNYDGVFTIKDTIVLDYKILNNILAFVNTVPSLLTFSIPGYSKKGLKVKSAYMKFKSNNNIVNISDIFLDSKEIDILGRGEVSFISDSIDLELNLKSDLGSKISKIPLVGYLLMGKDSISTTLSITGKLSDPDIKSLMAKDIAVAPLNILKRTIILPFDLIKGSTDIIKR